MHNQEHFLNTYMNKHIRSLVLFNLSFISLGYKSQLLQVSKFMYFLPKFLKYDNFEQNLCIFFCLCQQLHIFNSTKYINFVLAACYSDIFFFFSMQQTKCFEISSKMISVLCWFLSKKLEFSFRKLVFSC